MIINLGLQPGRQQNFNILITKMFYHPGGPQDFLIFFSLVVITTSSLPPSSNMVCNSLPKIRKQHDSKPLLFLTRAGNPTQHIWGQCFKSHHRTAAFELTGVCILPHAFNTGPFYFCWSDMNSNITCVRFFSQDKVM